MIFNQSKFKSSGMFSLFSKVRKLTKVDDPIPRKVYNNIDWTRCAIGGSFALKQFEDADWEPNDVDVFVAVSLDKTIGVEQFKEVVDKYVVETQSEITRKFRSTKEAREQHLVNGGGLSTEDFHDSILGTIEVKTEGLSKTIQFVAFRTNELFGWHHELISIMDAPPCILYTVNRRMEKCFIVGEEYLEFKRNGMQNICEGRRKQYEERGYK